MDELTIYKNYYKLQKDLDVVMKALKFLMKQELPRSSTELKVRYKHLDIISELIKQIVIDSNDELD